MKVRVQLIQNSPMHRVPTILLTHNKTQFIFNIIPTLLRFRKNHRINLFNSSNIFFTKNSIETLGGLPNYILFRIGVQNSNSFVANKIFIFCDNHCFNYLQKLRFKLGYKILRISYCNWFKDRQRYSISNLSLFNKLKYSPVLPKIFSNMESYLSSTYKAVVDYQKCSDLVSKQSNKYVTIQSPHFHSPAVDIYPVIYSENNITYSCYICIFAEMRKGVDVNIEQMILKTNITKLGDLKLFVKNGFIKTEDKLVTKQEYLFQQDFKPKNILIMHYASSKSIAQIQQNSTYSNYISNNKQTGLIIHIVEDMSTVNSQQFKSFINKFDRDIQHLWYNKDCCFLETPFHNEEHHLMDQQQWHRLFPNVFKNLESNRVLYYSNTQRKIIRDQFPFLKNFFYEKLFNFIKNDYRGNTYEQRLEAEIRGNRYEFISKILQEQFEMVKNLQNSSLKLLTSQFNPKVIFLGTASSMPTRYRNTLGIFVSISQQSRILLDCGEGTFEQLVDHFPPDKLEQQILKLRVIFITHIHADHNLGILNLISQRNRLMRKYKSRDKLFLIIPFNVYNWYVDFNKCVQNLSQGCQVLFTQILFNQNNLENIQQVKASFSVNQVKKPSFFSNKNNKQQGKQDPNNCRLSSMLIAQFEGSSKVKQLALSQIPNQLKVLVRFKQFLKQNDYIQFLPIKVIHCPQSYGVVISNSKYKVSYSGDTRPSQQFTKAAKDSTLMIHQATFNDQQSWKAEQYLHSTVSQAIKIGKESNSKNLALTHFNEQFKTPNPKNYNKSDQIYFKQNTILSLDHLEINLQNISNLSHITQFISKIDSEVTSKLKQIKKLGVQEQNKDD